MAGANERCDLFLSLSLILRLQGILSQMFNTKQIHHVFLSNKMIDEHKVIIFKNIWVFLLYVLNNKGQE